MCTYRTEKIAVRGSGKGPQGWFPVTDATIYFDHPVHFTDGHSLNIDFLNESKGPGARVAVELDAPSARALATAILATLESEGGSPWTTPPAGREAEAYRARGRA
jgi:Family of unknown function (DUF6295)